MQTPVFTRNHDRKARARRCTAATAYVAGILLMAAVPAVMADPGLPHTFTPGDTASASEVNENFRYVAPANVINVSVPEGGSALDAGDALRDAVNPANRVYAEHGAPSSDNPYLIRIAPGTYDLGNLPLEMLEWVHIEGAGVDATTITSTVSSSTAGTVVGAAFAELRFLTVRNEATGNRIGILSDDDLAITHVKVEVSPTNADTIGIALRFGASPRLQHVTVRLFTGGTVHGIWNQTGSPEIRDSTVEVGGAPQGIAVANLRGGLADPADASPRIVNSSIRALADNPVGVLNDGLGLEVHNTEIQAGGPFSSGTKIGIDHSNGDITNLVDVKVHGSTIDADEGSAIRIEEGFNLFLATTQLSAGTSIDATNDVIEIVCFAVYDEDFTNEQSPPLTTCPL